MNGLSPITAGHAAAIRTSFCKPKDAGGDLLEECFLLIDRVKIENHLGDANVLDLEGVGRGHGTGLGHDHCARQREMTEQNVVILLRFPLDNDEQIVEQEEEHLADLSVGRHLLDRSRSDELSSGRQQLDLDGPVNALLQVEEKVVGLGNPLALVDRRGDGLNERLGGLELLQVGVVIGRRLDQLP